MIVLSYFDCNFLVVQSNFVVVIQTVMTFCSILTLTFMMFREHSVVWLNTEVLLTTGLQCFIVVMFIVDLMIPFCCC